MDSAPSPLSAATPYSLDAVGAGAGGFHLRATGEFDLGAAEELRTFLEAHRGRGAGLLNLDVGGVTFLDCSCLGVLVAAQRAAVRDHGALLITGAGPALRRVIRILDLDHLLVDPAVIPTPG